MSRRLSAGLALAGALLAAPAVAELVAEEIDAGNAAERLIGGPDAIGGLGDWYLANDQVEVIVDDPARRHAKLNHGGTLVDAGVRGRHGDDQFARIFPIVNLDQRVQLNFDAIRAEVDPAGGFGRLVVTGAGMSAIARGGKLFQTLNPLVPDTAEIEQVVAEVVYEVRPGEPFVRITTTLRNDGDAPAPIFSYGDVWMRGGRSMRAFVGNTESPERAAGFHHRGFDRDAILEAAEVMVPSSFVAMAGLPPFPPVAYAIAAPERTAGGRLQFGVTGNHVTLLNAFAADPGWDEMGIARIMGATRGEIPPGEGFVFARRLYVSDRSDLASLTDRLFPDLGFADGTSGVVGRVEPAGTRASVLVETYGGHPITQVLAAIDGPEAGRYRAVLPPGRYALVLRVPHREPVRIQVEVPDGRFAEAPLQRFAEPAWLVFEPGFADGGPGRVVVTGEAGTPDPVFRRELLDFRIDGSRVSSGTETRELHFVGGGSDPGRVALPPGRYRLTATRGPEFGLDERVVELAGSGAEVRVEPFLVERIVALRDVVSADFHVHAQASDDSGMSNEARLASYVAEHVDVMVTTDHDHLGWFEPVLDALDVRERIRVVQGVEITSSTPSPAAPWTIGHHNAWPVPYQPLAHRKGAPPSQDLSVADLYSLLRRDYGARVVQLNHALGKGPGRDDDGNYFSHLATVGERYDPGRPIDAWPNRALLETASDGATRAIDFDAMEVMNGDSFAQYRSLREVWYSLLAQGFDRTATGNSDTHGPGELSAYPRNYVNVDGGFDPVRFDEAIRAGRLFMTTGPLIVGFQVGEGRMGDVVAARDGVVGVKLVIAAAPWVPVEEVRVLVNGEAVRTFRPSVPSEELMRVQEEFTLAVKRDAFVTVEAGAPLATDPGRWAAENAGPYTVVATNFVPQALSNPIWVDADGDGRITPPGLRRGTPGATDPSNRFVLVVGIVLVMAAVWWWLRRRIGLAPGS